MKKLNAIETKRFHKYYVGIDVGYKFHEAACIPYNSFIDEKESWKKTKTIKLNADGLGIHELLDYLKKVSRKPKDFFIVVEPTGGFYGACLIKAMEDAGYSIHFIDNKSVSNFKKNNLGIYNKNDRIDSLVMAYIAFQKALTPSTFGIQFSISPSKTQAILRVLSADRWSLQRQLQCRKNQLMGVLAATHPELKCVFVSGTTQPSVLSLVKKYPTALDMAKKSEVQLYKELVKLKLCRFAKEKSKKLKQLLKKPAVINYPYLVNRQKMLIDDIDRLTANIDFIDKQIVELVDHHPYKEIFFSFPMMGYIWACTFIGAIGDINRFSNYKKFKRYLGFTPDNKSSGISLNSTHLSHHGVRPTRRVLYQMSLALVCPQIKENSFRVFYRRLLERNMPKKKAIGHVAGRLAQVMYSCLKTGSLYDSSIHGRSMNVSVASINA